MQRLLILIVIAGLTSCAATLPPRGSGAISDYFHWRDVEDAAGWIVILPGASGLTVFDDERHYFDAAERFNAQGWNVLLVDYKPAYRAAMNPPGGSTGEKIAWVAEQAIAWMKASQPKMDTLPGAIVAWSLGAEGAIELVNDPDSVRSTGIRLAVMYYPSIPEKTRLNNQVPLLVLTGELDDITPPARAQAFIQDRDSSAANVELHTYPNARHGFDIASIVNLKTVRMLPLVGRKATLQYNAEAAGEANARVAAILERK